MIEIGATVPDVTVPDQNGQDFSLKSLVGKPFIIYFYPKDDTPGCSLEASQFRDSYNEFAERGVRLVGVSRDSAASHCKFIEKFQLPYPLLADEESKICDAFGVIVEKNMYGKKSMGIQRSTFLFDAQGVLEKVWPKVSVEGHVDAVRSALAAVK